VQVELKAENRIGKTARDWSNGPRLITSTEKGFPCLTDVCRCDWRRDYPTVRTESQIVVTMIWKTKRAMNLQKLMCRVHSLALVLRRLIPFFLRPNFFQLTLLPLAKLKTLRRVQKLHTNRLEMNRVRFRGLPIPEFPENFVKRG